MVQFHLLAVRPRLALCLVPVPEEKESLPTSKALAQSLWPALLPSFNLTGLPQGPPQIPSPQSLEGLIPRAWRLSVATGMGTLPNHGSFMLSFLSLWYQMMKAGDHRWSHQTFIFQTSHHNKHAFLSWALQSPFTSSYQFALGLGVTHLSLSVTAFRVKATKREEEEGPPRYDSWFYLSAFDPMPTDAR